MNNAERDSQVMEALYDAAGAYKDVLIDLENVIAAAEEVIAAVRVEMGPRNGVWCRVCAASWGDAHAEMAPRCPVHALVARIAQVKR